MDFLKDHIWIDITSIDSWLIHIWDSLPCPQARYIPSIFLPPVEMEEGCLDAVGLNQEINMFRAMFEDLPPYGTPCPLETLVYVLNCGPERSGNHFCVVIFAPMLHTIYLLGRKIGKTQKNNNSWDWDSWQGHRIWSKVCKLMGWTNLPAMTLQTVDWKQNGYDCGPIACQVAQDILDKGFQVDITGYWRKPLIMHCCHMLRWTIAEQVYQEVMQGNRKYNSIRITHAAQMEETYGLSELEAFDISQKNLQHNLSSMSNLHSIQRNLQEAMRNCKACHHQLEEHRHLPTSTPFRKESMKEAGQRRSEVALQGTYSMKNYVAGVIEERREQIHEEDHKEGQVFESLLREEPPTKPTADSMQARIGRFPRPILPPELPSRPNLHGLKLPFARDFDEYEGGPALEDLALFHDTKFQLQPSFLYICKQIMLAPASSSLFKDYGYRLFPQFAQAFNLTEPILVKQHLCPVGLTKPPKSITGNISMASKGRNGKNIKVNDLMVVGAEELLTIADAEGDSILLSGRSIEGQYVCLDLLRDMVSPEELAFSCDIDSLIWTTKWPQFKMPVDIYSIPIIRDKAPIWKNNHVQVELVYPQSEQDIHSGTRTEWLTNSHSLSTLPHLLFGALQGSSVVDLLLFFPRMMHRNPHNGYMANRIPKGIQDYFWDKVLLPALSSVIAPTRSVYLPLDRSHSSFKLGSGRHSPKYSLGPEELHRMIKRMKEIVGNSFI